jgi:hypothetical protein
VFYVRYVVRHKNNFALYCLTFYMLSLIKQSALFLLSEESGGDKPRRSRDRAHSDSTSG